MKLIPVNSCGGGEGDAYVEYAMVNGTSGYPLAILRSLTLMTKVHSHARGAGGWVV